MYVKSQQQQPNYIFLLSNDFYFTKFSNREKIS